jgi:molecular chaperone GrpE
MSTEPNTPDTVAADAAAAAQSQTDWQSEVARLQTELNVAEEKAKQHWDLLLRTKADADNLIKRAERNADTQAKFAVEKLLSELLAVLDSMDQGLTIKSESPDARSLQDGVQLTRKQMMATLEKFGVTLIDAAGKPFDANLHEAMVMQPSTDHEPNTVLTVLQNGYTLHGRLLRAARVIVSRLP